MTDLDAALVLFEQTLYEPTAEALLALRDLYLERGMEDRIRPVFRHFHIPDKTMTDLAKCYAANSDEYAIFQRWQLFNYAFLVTGTSFSVSLTWAPRISNATDWSNFQIVTTRESNNRPTAYTSIDVFLAVQLLLNYPDVEKTQKLLKPYKQWLGPKK